MFSSILCIPLYQYAMSSGLEYKIKSHVFWYSKQYKSGSHLTILISPFFFFSLRHCFLQYSSESLWCAEYFYWLFDSHCMQWEAGNFPNGNQIAIKKGEWILTGHWVAKTNVHYISKDSQEKGTLNFRHCIFGVSHSGCIFHLKNWTV